MIYGQSLFADPAATLDTLREAVRMVEDMARRARRVLGAAHPTAVDIDRTLKHARTNLRAREETPPAEAWAEEVD